MAVVSDVDELLEVLGHVDRLNSWVRSEAFRSQFWSGRSLRNLIYHYKTESIQEAIRRSATRHEHVDDLVVCRDCGGSGKYTDREGFEHGHCWRCSNTGNVALHFVRTHLFDRFTWHTPERQAWTFISWQQIKDLKRVAAGDWHVNKPGRDLPLDDVVASLAVIEGRFPRPPKRYVGDGWFSGGWMDDFASYRLHIGRTDQKRCVLCGRSDDLYIGWIHTVCGRLEWSAKVCRPCGKEHAGSFIFDACKLAGPGDLLTPAIANWVATHPLQGADDHLGELHDTERETA